MRTIGRAFPISKNQAKGYSYAKPPRRTVRRGKLKPNRGVTHIAAINGRGAYARSARTRAPSARARMNGAAPKARINRAKAALTRQQRKSFKKKLKTNSAVRRKSSAPSRRKTSMRRNAQTQRQRAASLRNLRKARAARRKGATTRRAAPKRRTTRRRATTTRRTGWTKAKRSAAAKKAARTRARRRATPNPKRRRKVRRNTTTRRKATANPRRRTVRRKATANPVRRRKATTRRRAPKRNRRRTIRRNAWREPAPAVRHSRAAKKGWARRRKTTRRRKSTARRATPRRSKRSRSLAAKRGWATRRGTMPRAGSTRRRRTGRRRTMRRNARMSYVSNRRRATRRRPMRRNRRRMRRNQGVGGAFRAGAFIVGGLFTHKILTALVRDLVFKPAVEAAAPEVATEAPTEGLGQINGYGGMLVGAGTAVAGILVASKLIKNADDRKYVVGGIAASFLHSLAVGLADMMGQPKVATMLAGVEDGTAANISAMYGLGAGTSIMPEYAAIRSPRGTGEYFASGVQGMGEYFRGGRQVSGMGEYFASGVQGLGSVKPYEAAAGFGASYQGNPDLYQAAAGIGEQDDPAGTNHIDPSSDLDRQLTIAEAAAGVGVGNLYQAAAGLGAATVSTVPRSSTWIPGMSDPAIWAGVKSVNEGQAANEMLTAGILQTDGGQGVFG